MNSKFYNFSKKVNSTAIPQGDSPWSPDIYLKQSTSILSPILLMGSPDSAASIFDYNYVILENKMHYFIDSWESVREDVWNANCSLDVLGTYRDEIFSTTAWVEYSENSGDSMLVDGRIPKKTTSAKYVSSAAFQPTFSATGSYSLTVTGEGGSVSTFSLSFNQLATLLNNVTNWINEVIPNDGDSESAIATLKYIVDGFKILTSAGSAPSNIRACYWLPWTYDTIGPNQEIKLGRYPTGVTAPKVPNTGSFSTTMNLTGRVGDWRDSSACTRINLFLPYCGVVSLDADALVGNNQITIHTGVDYKMGNVSYVVSSGSGLSAFDLGAYGGNAGVPMMIGTAVTSPIQAVNSISAIVGGLASGSGIITAMGLAGVTNLVNPQVTTVGGLGNASASAVQQNAFKLVEEKFPVEVEPSSVSGVIGIPTGKVLSLGSLTGYVKCRNASVSVSAGQNTISQINNFLNGGVYIE